MQKLFLIFGSIALALSASAESIPGVTINIYDFDNSIHTVISVSLSTKYPEAARIVSASGKVFMTYDDEGNRTGYSSMLIYKEPFQADKTVSISKEQQSTLIDLYENIHFSKLQKPQDTKPTSTGPSGVQWSLRDTFYLKKSFVRFNIFDSKYSDEHLDLNRFVRKVFEIGDYKESQFR